MGLLPVRVNVIEYLLTPFICPGPRLFEKHLSRKICDDITYVLKALCGSRGQVKECERQKDYLGGSGLNYQG